MFRRDIIEKIIEDRGDIAVDIDVLYSDGEYNNYEPIALYRLDVNGDPIALYRLDVNCDNPFKLINKKEYQSYIRDEKLNQLLND